MNSQSAAEKYERVGVIPVANIVADSKLLYLDLMKRAVCNLLYEDIAVYRYDQLKKPIALNRFDLDARIWGEDLPTEAHTMIGWKRLSNVQDCVAKIFENSIKGDFVETGVFRGGSVIFMRALLKAYGSTDRKIYACDTFIFDPPPPGGKFIDLVAFLASRLVRVVVRIPFRPLRIALYRFFESRQKSFPKSENPSEDWINCVFHVVSNLDALVSLTRKDRTSLNAVRSHFSRYGLLDAQVIFLKGFFSDTLPKADIKSIALLRCDGDSYESTYGVLQELYAKVSPGGFVVIDDYNSFSDCKDAVDRFRSENNIHAPFLPIDHLSMYWQKPF